MADILLRCNPPPLQVPGCHRHHLCCTETSKHPSHKRTLHGASLAGAVDMDDDLAQRIVEKGKSVVVMSGVVVGCQGELAGVRVMQSHEPLGAIRAGR